MSSPELKRNEVLPQAAIAHVGDGAAAAVELVVVNVDDTDSDVVDVIEDVIELVSFSVVVVVACSVTVLVLLV